MTNDFKKFVDEFRNTIPNQYNQINLVDDLLNNDIDYFISISTRTDGKSFNYIGFLLALSIKYDIKIMLIGRHYTIRKALVELCEEIINNHNWFKRDEFKNNNEFFNQRTDDYIKIGMGSYNNIAVVSDLNSATDLKYRSNFLKQYEIIVYDEFLALEDDYLSDEWDKLKTIYETIDRNHNDDTALIKHPKIMLLGNAVNFDSPLLANLNIFERLEKQTINTTQRYDNIIMEMRKNENTNKKRNLRAFNQQNTNDSMTTGKFSFNDYNIINDVVKKEIMQNPNYFFIKDNKRWIKITYNIITFQMYIKVIPYNEDEFYVTELKDINENNIYLSEDKYYDIGFINKHVKSKKIFYVNAYSKNYILKNHNTLNLFKLCRKHLHNTDYDEVETKEKVFQNNTIDITINRLLKEMF